MLLHLSQVGYNAKAAEEYRHKKPWTVNGLDTERRGTIRDDVVSKPGTRSVMWNDSGLIQSIVEEFLEEKF